MRRLLLAATLFLVSCGSGGGDAEPTGWTLLGPGIRVEISSRPYRVTVRDESGALILETLGTGATDGYGALGWTRGKIDMVNVFSPGYFRAEMQLEPWRDAGRVVSGTLSGDGALDLTLGGEGAQVIKVHHEVRAGALRVEARLEGGDVPRAWSAGFRAPADEGYLGLGERFTRTNFRGLSIYSWVEEGGIGSKEGDPPGEANPWPNGESQTYYPVPFFLSTHKYGFWLDTTYYNRYDLAAPPRTDAWRAFSAGPTLAYEVYVPTPGDARPWPYHLIDRFTERVGRPMIPPAWTFGPRRRINHGDRQGDKLEIQAMRDLDLAITSMDDSFHYLPNGASAGALASLPAAIAEANALGYRVCGYFNSFFSENPDDPIAPDTQTGVDNGYFLKDAAGQPAQTWIITGSRMVKLYILDFTSAAASAWYTSLFDRAISRGHAGWMYDFGEYVPAAVVGASGIPGEALHNLYPVIYQKAAFDSLEAGPRKGDWLTFVRSGFTGASQYSPMVWSGDPAASFDSADGLPSMVRAGINIGIAGAPNWGGDIGGYHCVTDGTEAADGELLTRWIEQGALTPSMQDQDACVGGDSSRKASIWNSQDAQDAWKTYARLHTRLQPYFRTLARVANRTGAPIIRHVFLENPDRADWAGVDDTYYLGPAFLVAPVVARGARQKRVDLPPGKWLEWQAQTVVEGGRAVMLDAPLAKLPLLLRQGQLVPLLDPTIDTLAPETNPTVVGPADVAGVYDVVGLIGKGTARFDLFDDGWLEAKLDGAVTAPGFAAAENEAALSTCDACYRIDALDGGLSRVRITVDEGHGGLVDAGGLQLRAYAGRRIRWDLYVLPQ